MPREVKRLTPKQLRFVQEYLKDLNATQAAIRAGYSSRTAMQQGSRLLSKAEVAQAVAERADRVTAKAEVTVERIVQEAAAIAFHDARKLFRDDGTLKDPHELDDETAAAIAGLEVEELFEGRGKAREHVGRLHKVKRWEKTKALELLAKYRKMFDDAPKVNVNAGAIVFLPRNGREPV